MDVRGLKRMNVCTSEGGGGGSGGVIRVVGVSGAREWTTDLNCVPGTL